MDDGLPLLFCVLPARSTSPCCSSLFKSAVMETGLIPVRSAISPLVGDLRKNID